MDKLKFNLRLFLHSIRILNGNHVKEEIAGHGIIITISLAYADGGHPLPIAAHILITRIDFFFCEPISHSGAPTITHRWDVDSFWLAKKTNNESEMAW